MNGMRIVVEAMLTDSGEFLSLVELSEVCSLNVKERRLRCLLLLRKLGHERLCLSDLRLIKFRFDPHTATGIDLIRGHILCVEARIGLRLRSVGARVVLVLSDSAGANAL